MINKDHDVRDSFNVGHYLNKPNPNPDQTSKSNEVPNSGDVRGSMAFQIPSFNPSGNIGFNPVNNSFDPSKVSITFDKQIDSKAYYLIR